jgi:hypothetical protein
MTLEGKWIWIWNLKNCDGGDLHTVADRLKANGCAGALIKAWDGGKAFPQYGPTGLTPIDQIVAAVHEAGLRVATWGYCYARDPIGEANAAILTWGGADAIVLDVEAEYKGQAQAAETLCVQLKAGLPDDLPLLYSSFAIARYHQTFPFNVFNRLCAAAVPQVYWNAFGWPWAQALGWTYTDYFAMSIGPGQVLPVAGLYREGTVQYPAAVDVGFFMAAARQNGSPGCSFWSYEHMDSVMWDAVKAVEWPVAGMPWTGWKEGEERMNAADKAWVLQHSIDQGGQKLVRGSGPDVYIVRIDGKRKFPVSGDAGPKAFDDVGWRWETVDNIEDVVLHAIPDAP